MTREITTPVVLAHTNLVPGTETVSVKGASTNLIRDSDYIMDYDAGILRFLSDGAAVEQADLIEQNGLDVQYSYAIDVGEPQLFESQNEVYDEVASRIEPFVISVKNAPINDVSRILNLTTQEEYTPIAINNQEISFQGVAAPRTLDIAAADTTLQSSVFDTDKKLYSEIYSLNYPANFTASVNPTVLIAGMQSTSLFPRILVIGGQDVLTNTVELLVSFEVTNVILITGGRSLRTSTTTLRQGTDYTFTLVPQIGTITTQKLILSLLPSAILQIRTNSLYIVFNYNEPFELKENATFRVTTHPVHDVVTFTTDVQILPRFYLQADVDEIAFDKLVLPEIQVLDPISGEVFQSNVDYQINSTARTITKLPGSKIDTAVLVTYLEQRELKADFTLVRDIVLVDYVWGTNSINWESLQKDTDVTFVMNLFQGQQLITLQRQPKSFKDILIYLKDDPFKKPQTTPLSYNRLMRRLKISPISQKGTYVLEYVAVDEPVQEGTPYFASYKYGATRRVVGDKFAKMFGLDNTTTPRDEVFSLAAGSTQVQLSRSPTSLDTVTIYNEFDPEQTPIATPTDYNSVTGILSFTPISSAGRKVINYLTIGFDTQSLRRVIEQLFVNFSEGPTQVGFENIVSAFVDTPPVITSGLSDRFVLANAEHTVGTQIKPRTFEQSLPLSDGTSSVAFLPSRFNLAAAFETSRGSYVRAPVASNLGLQEGTLEFLTGILFNPNDSELHYFVDIVGKNPRRNRFSLYKSENNFLNFDIWDQNGDLFRTSLGVDQIYYTEIIFLNAGDTQAKLSQAATPAQLDLNNNQTPDLYEGLETKFIILPETPTFPATFKKASIKVLSYDPPTQVVTFEPVAFTGRYVFSYVSGLTKFEETENFIAITWKLHTNDGEAPFYKLYVNGVLAINRTLEEISVAIETEADDRSHFDTARYDIDIYEENS